MRYLLSVLVLLFALTGPVSAQDRLALVIGNSSYDAAAGGRLANPSRDADTMAAALRDVGFDVTVEKDLDDKGLKRAIRDHRNRLASAGSGTINFFYYAGHGANDSEGQFGGTNYFIPVGANVSTPQDLDIEAVELGDAIRAFSNAAVSFVVFDACRNYPFAGSTTRSANRGFLTEPERKGTFIAFSSEPGSVALDDSGYAEALATALRTPGLDHRDVFTQVRSNVYQKTGQSQFSWFRDGILGNVTFSAAVAPVTGPSANSPSFSSPIEEKIHGLGAEAIKAWNANDGGEALLDLAIDFHSRAEQAHRTDDDVSSLQREIAILAEAGCERGNTDLCSNYAHFLAKGTGVPRDHRKASAYFKRLCGQNSPSACFNAAVSAGRQSPDFFPMVDTACDLDHGRACLVMGKLLHELNHTARTPPGGNWNVPYQYHGIVQETQFYYRVTFELDGIEHSLGREDTKKYLSKSCQLEKIEGCFLNFSSGIYQPDWLAELKKLCDSGTRAACAAWGVTLIEGKRHIEPSPDNGLEMLETQCNASNLFACVKLQEIYTAPSQWRVDHGIQTEITVSLLVELRDKIDTLSR